MYWNKNIRLLEYIFTLPPPSKLDKKVIFVVPLHNKKHYETGHMLGKVGMNRNFKIENPNI